jgi:hypothetical protein
MLILIVALLLSACGASAGNATETPTATAVDLGAVATQAVSTAYAQLTQTALFAPTETYTPTMTMTPTSATPRATQPGAIATSTSCGNYAFVSETIPDGTTMPVGTSFTKTWTIKNTGTCTWTTSFSLVYGYGEQMGGQNHQLAAEVPVGGTTTLSVDMKVPNKSGTLNGIWVLKDDKGQQVGAVLYVSIVAGNPTAAPTGSATATPETTDTPTLTPTP